jgi:hypothetical protein
MTRQAKIAFAAALGLMALTAVVLGRLQAFQRVGQPGLQVVPCEVLREDGVVVGTNGVDLPERVLNFESKVQPIAKIVCDWLPKDTTYGQRAYQAPDGFWVMVNTVLMGTDRTSIHKPEYCLAGQGFQTLKEEQTAIKIAEPHPYRLPVYKMTLSREVTAKDGAKVRHNALFVYWFVADGQLTASHNQRMWWMSRDLITRQILQRWAYVSSFSACRPGEEDATYARMAEFLAAAVPRFQRTTGPPSAMASSP